MGEESDTKSLANLFTKGSHRNVTILYLVQNQFDQNTSSRTVSLNSHSIVVFRNLKDESKFRTMAAQILPKNLAVAYGCICGCHRITLRIF